MPTIILELDDDDARTVHEAIAKRQSLDMGFRPPLPDGEGNLEGRYIAEICRSWVDALESLE